MNPRDLSREQFMSMLFAEMVVQQTNMAMIFLGKAPHPQTGKTEQNLAMARLFIDQLEMLELKTKGNLSREEETLLKQSLSHLRLSFVEAVNQQGGSAPPTTSTEPRPSGSATPGPSEPLPSGSAPPAQDAQDEPRKRFTKKY